MAIDDATKLEMAKSAAKTMFATLASVPHEVQLEASIILFESLVIANVKPEYRLMLLNSVTQKTKARVKHHLRTGELPS